MEIRKNSQEYFDMLIHECGIGARILEDTPTGTLYKKLHAALIYLTTPDYWMTEDGSDSDEDATELAEELFAFETHTPATYELFPVKRLDSRLFRVEEGERDGYPKIKDVTNEAKD